MNVDKLFIQQLRKADCVNFSSSNGLMIIKTSQRKDSKYYNETEFSYSKHYETTFYEMPNCRFYSTYIEMSGWQALSKIIRVNDVLYFQAKSGACAAMNDAGIYMDELTVKIRRNDKLFIYRLHIEFEFASEQQYRAIKDG